MSHIKFPFLDPTHCHAPTQVPTTLTELRREAHEAAEALADAPATQAVRRNAPGSRKSDPLQQIRKVHYLLMPHNAPCLDVPAGLARQT